ncbi:hypothetical protein [Phyllobacterium chamaecytisi]|uniref:hypothetical protein n=1 Tax=Phyllobacterium chamaecytisi TaxID=2876082 RepID=UPI001CCEAA3C|nr:hypothetical protein [Phyllobacterium sp. KW56]MBZ9605807.1 hypothetical protein [Phyllobacterium sp. KW56]
MNGEDEKPKPRHVVRHLKRLDYGEALRSYHKPLPNDEGFEELLQRLDEAEKRINTRDDPSAGR